MVNVGDVVALIETDKVTVDIKADIAGVLTKRFGEVDDNIDVGAEFYTLDADAEAIAAAPAAAPVEEVAASTPAAAESTTPPPLAFTPVQEVATHGHRSPSMKFLGKQGWYDRLHSIASTGGDVHAAAGLDSTFDMSASEISPEFGRPVITEEEMEALELGMMDGEIGFTGGSKYATWS